MKKYVKTHFGEYILCIFISVALAENVFAGYEMIDSWSGNLPIVIGVIALVLTFLFISYINKKIQLVSIISPILALVIILYFLWQDGVLTGNANIDTHPLLFWMIVIMVSGITFWSSRGRAGIIMLFLSGSIMNGAFAFLRYPVSLISYYIFIISLFTLYLYRIYCMNSSNINIPEKNLFKYLLQSAVTVVLAVVLASGAYYGIIKSLAPSTDEIKLTEKLMSLQILERVGISTTMEVTLDNKEQEKLKNDAQMPEEQKRPVDDKKYSEADKAKIERNNNIQGKNILMTMAIKFQRNLKMIWISLILFLLVLFGGIGGKYYLRKRWYRRILKGSKEDGIMELYEYFIKKLRKVGVKRPAGYTLLEYVKESQEKLEGFTVYNVSFLRLTEIYMDVFYGCKRITDKEWELFQDFYKDFCGNMRRERGRIRYYLEFFGV